MLPGRELTIDTTLKLLYRQRWLLIVPLFLGVLGGLLYSRLQPSLYRSDAVIQVVPQRVPESYVSATVTERVEDRLRALAQQVSRMQLRYDHRVRPARTSAEYPLDDVIQLMTKRVIIEPLVTRDPSRREAQTEAFRVSFDYQDAVVAQKVVEKLATFFIDTNARERGTQADETSAFLEAQLADARTRLEAHDKKFKAFRERNSGRLPTQTQTNMQAIQNTQMALQAMVESLARDRDRKLMLERLLSDATADEAVGSAAGVSAAPARRPPTMRCRRCGRPRHRAAHRKRHGVFLLQLEVPPEPAHRRLARQKRSSRTWKSRCRQGLQAPARRRWPWSRSRASAGGRKSAQDRLRECGPRSA
jgi:LPS O-antigen subunit length determinant protein (WzzB/FepE family)